MGREGWCRVYIVYNPGVFVRYGHDALVSTFYSHGTPCFRVPSANPSRSVH